MKTISILISFVLLGAAVPGIAGEAEVRKYCEDAALLMKVSAEQREAYIASCIEERKVQLAEEK